MADERFDDETLEPRPGWRWCPECNGEGEITVMDGTPNLDVTTFACSFPGCADGKGIVPVIGGPDA